MRAIRQHYARLLCLSGLLALGLAVWAAQAPNAFEAPQPSAVPEQPLKPLAAMPVEPEHRLWHPPEPLPGLRSGGPRVVVDLFTPPKWFVHPDTHQWMLAAYPPQEADFGLRLKALKPRYYRYQYQGFVKNRDTQSDTDYAAILMDTETGSSLLAQVGTTFGQNTLRLSSLDYVHEQQPDGSVEQHIQITLLDKALQQNVVLSNRQPRVRIGFELHLYLSDKPQTVFRCYAIGETFDMGNASFTIRTIDWEEPSITVEKQFSDSDHKQTQKLFPEL